jgi:hypothetical protein
MEIKINLNDVFRDEDGAPEETMEESIRRQIIDKLTGDMRKRLFDRVDEALAMVLQSEVAKAIEGKMPDLIDDILNVTYTPVTRYGDRGAPTTFRSEIVKAIGENLKYEPRNYSSEENAFTRAVKSIVELKAREIQKAITEQVDTKFKEDAIKFAVSKLSERLGLAK